MHPIHMRRYDKRMLFLGEPHIGFISNLIFFLRRAFSRFEGLADLIGNGICHMSNYSSQIVSCQHPYLCTPVQCQIQIFQKHLHARLHQERNDNFFRKIRFSQFSPLLSGLTSPEIQCSSIVIPLISLQ